MVARFDFEDALFEQKIELLKQRKSQRFAALFGQAESESDIDKASTTLTKKDFDYLLTGTPHRT